MKLLHTSDWHVGKQIRGRTRIEEHREVLAEVAEVARREAVDVVLVVGDLFDTAAPAADAEDVVYRALLELAATGAHVVVLSGNHDSAARLRAVAPVLELGTITTRATFVGPADGGVVEGETSAGERYRIACVPFLSQRHVVRADDLMSAHADEHAGAYADRVRRIVAALCAGFEPDAVNVVAAHLHVDGGLLGGGERTAHTIFDYAVSPHAFPATAHYVALGHLHRTQRVPGPCPIHYSGSPLQLDFGEVANEPSVLVVEAAAGTPAEVRPVALRGGRRLRTVEGTVASLAALVDAGDPSVAGDDHLRVVVHEAARAGLADEVRELLPGAVDVIVRPPEGAASTAADVPVRSGRTPHELFAAFLAERGHDDARLVALFDELHDAIHAERHDEVHAPDPA